MVAGESWEMEADQEVGNGGIFAEFGRITWIYNRRLGA
jgi:hypothetical protein